MELPELEAVVQAAQAEGGVVLVDESFMPHMGPNWHDHSALALVEKYPATIIVVNSWTKIWCCPGLRLGSVACAEHWYKIMKKNQTPWSCNNMAQALCAAVASDVEFQQQTWKLLPEWRQRASVSKVSSLLWDGRSTRVPHCGCLGCLWTAGLPKLQRGRLLSPKTRDALCAGVPALVARRVCASASALLLNKTSFRKHGVRCSASEGRALL